MSISEANREAAFRALFADVYADALRFAQRRADRDVAEEAVADAMLVVWRRFSEAPHTPEARRAWVFGVVRGCLLNARRGSQRRAALAVRLAHSPPVDSLPADASLLRLDIARRWPELSAEHQEALSLAVFEQLTASEAACVLGISTTAYRARLSRARRALRALLSDDSLPHLYPVTETS